MGAKAGLEYEARNATLNGERYGPNPDVSKVANDMAAEGWTLFSFNPDVRNSDRAILIFSRPKRSDPGAAREPTR
jgi:hypothetical protein